MTPRPLAGEAPDTTARVQRVLYFRCRRGEPEALAALLYSLVDRLYTAASYVVPDETTAVTTVAEAWHDLAVLLQGPAVGGHVRRRAFRLLRRRLVAHAGAEQVRKACRRAETEVDEGLLSFPTGDLAVLLEAIPAHAELIAARARARKRRVRQGALLVGALVAFVMGYNLWLRGTTSNSAAETKLACLRERVVRQDLVTALRDCADELSDPEGADRYEAHLLRQVGLVLEELVNVQGARGGPVLGYLARRARQESLGRNLADLMAEREGLDRRELSQAQLVLEEVESL
jgi:hypothetical protein